MNQPALFPEFPDLHRSPLVGRTDGATARAAATATAAHLTELQTEVLAAIAHTPGGMSAREAERLPQFVHRFGPSTIRKRVCELARAGVLVEVGVESRSGRTAALVYTQCTNPELPRALERLAAQRDAERAAMKLARTTAACVRASCTEGGGHAD